MTGWRGQSRLALLALVAVLALSWCPAASADLADETALAEALRGGMLKAAGLDVFEEEPPPKDHPLLGLENIVLSPHSAALTVECAERMAMISARNCLDGLDGRLDRALVANPQVLGG